MTMIGIAELICLWSHCVLKYEHLQSCKLLYMYFGQIMVLREFWPCCKSTRTRIANKIHLVLNILGTGESQKTLPSWNTSPDCEERKQDKKSAA